MELIFFGFIGVVIAVMIISGYRRAGRRRSHTNDGGMSSGIFWGVGDSSHSTPGSHHHAHSHDSGCNHGGHDSGGCGDSGGGDSGGGGSSD